ncbi:putative receptor-like protein kinase At4g00960 isoform X1 [Papaver somniferum]|uniref:putative receptor-like protein kinase At4g00960 isoform X1 n=2 Tax=Papaver somniferum TaxID=3469 RepID=UPI000E7031BD|nr:putative receptor-like protein kinase At4g00960 isoform X1 [Papaver somniferum]XP_026432509.1 putative receptor-like protein kinase At4g00960 isoform X1 [Papaver somniferum]XP_026432510.1 putative receptor-like protein kinase At4g00960 isoform X1 [Papaver somniferum]XP_026432511.1 putative receptor-like protein kinase At4g00960 isoform X1 [Papaver somniferum]
MMGCFNFGFIFFAYLFCVSNLLITIQYTTAQQYVYHFCLGDNYTANSTFQDNLNSLLPIFSSIDESTIIDDAFFNYSVGQSPDTVYGSYQCRPDVDTSACPSCVKMATQEITGRCPNSKQAIIWYAECMCRYSNQYYFGIMQDKPGVYLWNNVNNVSIPDQLTPILGDLLKKLVGETVSSYRRNFADGKTNVTDNTKVYAFVQCTADISSSDCSPCLRGAISELPNCCDGKSGGRIIRPSCNFRYELYPFLLDINAPSPPLASSPAPILSPPPPLASLPPPPSPTNTTTSNSNGKKSPILAISIVVPSVIVIISVIVFWFFCYHGKKTTKYFDGFNDEMQSTESFQFNYSIVSAATDNFAEANKLGEGGFGSVYKGTLSDSQEIAVKRLSRTSRQGGQEFKNEVTLVAKLQQRNLVKLIGFSLTGEEKLLIYEFMPNGSLDKFLFDPVKRTQLDWERRCRIIGGVARGLQYLHEESRLKIIHRDLKASNILLDIDMNPKIADFGMARLFVLDQTQASTTRIVGTHGYMAPEYIMHGEFSIKSDVFSFGVLVLEILCGERNSDFHKTDVAWNLLSYAWKHWKNGSAIEILDPAMKDTCCINEAVRCIHVALLCVQENFADRPSMPTVVLMLNNYSELNPYLPSAPAFLADSTRHIKPHPTLYPGNSEERGFSKNETNSEAATCSLNEVSVTEIRPR